MKQLSLAIALLLLPVLAADAANGARKPAAPKAKATAAEPAPAPTPPVTRLPVPPDEFRV